jgi:hypothetical protein
MTDTTDNGSILLGWMVIAIMILFGAMSVATHEPTRIDLVESDGVTPTATEEPKVKGVTHSIEDKEPRIVIENEENLIPTRLQI